jgi:IS1 family transposase
MNRLPTERRAQILEMMVEGVSIRAICRLTGVSKNTVVKLLVDAGEACSAYQDRALRSLPCKRVQVDEIWSFCYAKDKNVPEEKKGQFGYGDVWTWTAICADTKLVPCWLVGGRDGEYALAFVDDLRSRLANRVHLTSDGHSAYLQAVEDAFGADVDYAQLVKLYGTPPEVKGGGEAHRRYSPGQCVGARKATITGNPDPEHISTSYAERHNLTMRMSPRRFTRLTNAFSKKVEHHAHALSIYFMHYNFCRIHQSLRVTPAMAASVTSRLWEIEDIAALVDAAAPKPGKRGPYKKRVS